MLKSGRAPDFRDRDYAKKNTAIATALRQAGIAKTELELCEMTITASLTAADNAFAAIARTVATVKDRELWRQGGHASFAEWGEKVYGWGTARGYQLAEGHAVLQGLPKNVSTIVENESQARALKAAPLEQRAEVVREVAQSGPVTAKRITQAVAARKPAPKVIDVQPEPHQPNLKREKHCPTCQCGVNSQ